MREQIGEHISNTDSIIQCKHGFPIAPYSLHNPMERGENFKSVCIGTTCIYSPSAVGPIDLSSEGCKSDPYPLTIPSDTKLQPRSIRVAVSVPDNEIRIVNSADISFPPRARGTDRLKRLEVDLNAIREQLYLLTRNKNLAVTATTVMQTRYNLLMKKNDEQSKQILLLRYQNESLVEKMRRQEMEKVDIKDMQEVRKDIEKCEVRLGILYNEYMEAAKSGSLRSQSATRRSELELKTAQTQSTTSTRSVAVNVARQSMDLEVLMQNYQQAKETEIKLQQENANMIQDIRTLEAELCNVRFKIEGYCGELENKSRVIDELSSVINTMNQEPEGQWKTELKQLHEHCVLLKSQVEKCERRLKQYEENDCERCAEIQYLQEKEYDLVQEIEHLKTGRSTIDQNTMVTIASSTKCVQTHPQMHPSNYSSFETITPDFRQNNEALGPYEPLRNISQTQDFSKLTSMRPSNKPLENDSSLPSLEASNSPYCMLYNKQMQPNGVRSEHHAFKNQYEANDQRYSETLETQCYGGSQHSLSYELECSCQSETSFH